MPGTRLLTTVALVALACAGCGAATGADQALPDGPVGRPRTMPTAWSATASAPTSPGATPACSWTYQTAGNYTIRGCKNWLVVVWRVPWYIPIVFPLEVCHTDQVGVQEAQVLSGLPPR